MTCHQNYRFNQYVTDVTVTETKLGIGLGSHKKTGTDIGTGEYYSSFSLSQ